LEVVKLPFQAFNAIIFAFGFTQTLPKEFIAEAIVQATCVQ